MLDRRSFVVNAYGGGARSLGDSRARAMHFAADRNRESGRPPSSGSPTLPVITEEPTHSEPLAGGRGRQTLAIPQPRVERLYLRALSSSWVLGEIPLCRGGPYAAVLMRDGEELHRQAFPARLYDNSSEAHMEADLYIRARIEERQEWVTAGDQAAHDRQSPPAPHPQQPAQAAPHPPTASAGVDASMSDTESGEEGVREAAPDQSPQPQTVDDGSWDLDPALELELEQLEPDSDVAAGE